MNNDSINRESNRELAQDELRLKEFVRVAREASDAGEKPAQLELEKPAAEAPKPAPFQPVAAAKPNVAPAAANRPSPAAAPAAVSFREPLTIKTDSPIQPSPRPSPAPAVGTRPAPPVKKAASVIAEGTTIVGKIKTEGNLEVMGVVEGDIDAGGDVLVRGKVTGNIKGVKLELFSCQVKGMLTASASASIDSESMVLGNVAAESVVFDGKLKGNINAVEMATLNSNSYLTGDITSKTITIETGAVINGQIKMTGKDGNEDIFEKLWPTSPAKKASASDRKAGAKSEAQNEAPAEPEEKSDAGKDKE